MDDDSELLTIGELAERSGIATSALRYYEELGLLTPDERVSGHRRYREQATLVVGVILFLADLGFTLAEIGTLTESRTAAPEAWQTLARSKVDELQRQIADAEAAALAIEHALSCPLDDILECPNFWSVVGARLDGRPLAAAHAH